MIFSYGENINSVACQGFTKRASPTNISREWVCLYFINEGIEVGICEWVTVSKIYLIFRMWKRIFPRQGEEWFILSQAFTIPVLKILNTFPPSVPT